MKKTAIVIGATGLVGSHIADLLLDDERYSTVKVFHRRSTGIRHRKLEEYIIDFDKIETWCNQLTGDELYSAMGTTIRKAGSKEAQYKIDVTYPLKVAEAAASNGVKKYSLVSSAGADKDSKLFYPRIKGELDEAVKKLSFDRITIMRPSILEGDRQESRPGYRFGEGLTLSFRLDNLLNERYREHLSRVENRDAPMPGRNLNVMMRWEF